MFTEPDRSCNNVDSPRDGRALISPSTRLGLSYLWLSERRPSESFWSIDLLRTVFESLLVVFLTERLSVINNHSELCLNSFPASLHCYTLAGAITHLLNESRMCWSKTQARKTHRSHIMHMKNYAIMNTNDNCLMLASEMWIQKVVQDCASFGILIIYCIFALIILLNMIQLSYLIKMLFAQCLWTCLHSSAVRKTQLEARIKLIFIFK